MSDTIHLVSDDERSVVEPEPTFLKVIVDSNTWHLLGCLVVGWPAYLRKRCAKAKRWPIIAKAEGTDISPDLLLVATGSSPNIESLGLAELGIATTPFIKSMRSCEPTGEISLRSVT